MDVLDAAGWPFGEGRGRRGEVDVVVRERILWRVFLGGKAMGGRKAKELLTNIGRLW